MALDAIFHCILVLGECCYIWLMFGMLLPILHLRFVTYLVPHEHRVDVAHLSVLHDLLPTITMQLERSVESYPWPISLLAQSLS